jgi:hypothetical protein
MYRGSREADRTVFLGAWRREWGLQVRLSARRQINRLFTIGRYHSNEETTAKRVIASAT